MIMPFPRVLPLVVLLALVWAQIAAAQTRPAASPPPMTQIVAQGAGSAPAMSTGWGLCQCISDFKNLEFHCPGSADACQSTCGAQFSFKPDARCGAAGQ